MHEIGDQMGWAVRFPLIRTPRPIVASADAAEQVEEAVTGVEEAAAELKKVVATMRAEGAQRARRR